jgi:hypothetical protein
MDFFCLDNPKFGQEWFLQEIELRFSQTIRQPSLNFEIEFFFQKVNKKW